MFRVRFNLTIYLARHKFFSWGSGAHGRLGHGDTTDVVSPKMIEQISNISIVPKKVVAGYDHTAILTDKGEVYIWGAGSHGELGFGMVSRQKTPVLLDFSKNVAIKDIVLGYQFTVAIAQNGDCYTWGNTLKGRLGNGVDDGTLVEEPTKVELEKPVLSVFGGKDHVIVLTQP